MSDRLAEIEARLAALAHYSHPPVNVRWRNREAAHDAVIAHASEDLRDLLSVAKAAQEFMEEYRAMNGGEEPGDGPTRRLAWALANLEGGAS